MSPDFNYEAELKAQIKEVDDLLDLAEVYIAHYPDDVGLLIGQHSLLEHKQELVLQLSHVMDLNDGVTT